MALLEVVGGALAGAIVGTVIAVYGTRHLTVRAIHRLEAAGRHDEAAARRAVLAARARTVSAPHPART